MRAAWAIGRIGALREVTRAIDFVRGIGFDTLVTSDACPDSRAYARDCGIRLLAVVSPHADEGLADSRPDLLQRMRDEEYAVASAVAGMPWTERTAGSFRWHPLLLDNPTLCFANPDSLGLLENRIVQALERADGIALDGFGFTNYYACFCAVCERKREALQAENADLPRHRIVSRVSEETLVAVHDALTSRAREAAPEALVINHLWPPFRPDEAIGRKLRLDFCTQTISWFYPPVWDLWRVEAEARTHKHLEDAAVNRFAPFIGITDADGDVSRQERLEAEMEIALRYGEGSLVVSRLSTLQAHPELANVVAEAFANLES